MWRNDTKCKYMFMLPLKNLARKGLLRIYTPIAKLLLKCLLNTFLMGLSLTELLWVPFCSTFPDFWIVGHLQPKRCLTSNMAGVPVMGIIFETHKCFVLNACICTWPGNFRHIYLSAMPAGVLSLNICRASTLMALAKLIPLFSYLHALGFNVR